MIRWKSIIRTFFRLCTATIAAACTVWLAGRIANDRLAWSQYLYWIPAWLALGTSGLGLVCWLLSHDSRSKSGRFSVLWAAPFAACLACVGWEWRLWHIFRSPAPAGAVRILAWNTATDFMDDFAERVASLSPAVVAVANRPAHAKWDVIKAAVGGAGSTLLDRRISLVSRYPVLRSGRTSLRISGSRPHLSIWQNGSLASVDRGEAMFAVLDATRELGRTIVVWVVDMPSDPLINRQNMFSQAAATVADFRGEDAKGFPPPDVVIGDFNTPRGSESIRRLVGALSDAHREAGLGPALTWHQRAPFMGLDQAFVSPSLRVCDYRVVDLGAGQHRAQYVDVLPGR